MPPAARAVVRSAHEDARRARAGTRYAAQLAARRLADAGWALAPHAAANGAQAGTQDVAT